MYNKIVLLSVTLLVLESVLEVETGLNMRSKRFIILILNLSVTPRRPVFIPSSNPITRKQTSGVPPPTTKPPPIGTSPTNPLPAQSPAPSSEPVTSQPPVTDQTMAQTPESQPPTPMAPIEPTTAMAPIEPTTLMAPIEPTTPVAMMPATSGSSSAGDETTQMPSEPTSPDTPASTALPAGESTNASAQIQVNFHGWESELSNAEVSFVTPSIQTSSRSQPLRRSRPQQSYPTTSPYRTCLRTNAVGRLIKAMCFKAS